MERALGVFKSSVKGALVNKLIDIVLQIPTLFSVMAIVMMESVIL